tara:strand:- start:113 stop:355 length:243 start_codon:yes stop_codon:yes gene_type:complete
MLAKTDKVGLARDMNNNALLANDITMLHSHREEYRIRQTQSNSLNDINIMKEQIHGMMKEFQEIKQLLQNHITRENKCQA